MTRKLVHMYVYLAVKVTSFIFLHWDISERHMSRDKQIPCAFQPSMYRRMSVFSTSSVVAKIHAPQTPFPVPAVQSPVANACLELSDRVAAQLATQVPLALFQRSVCSSIMSFKNLKVMHQMTPFAIISRPFLLRTASVLLEQMYSPRS